MSLSQSLADALVVNSSCPHDALSIHPILSRHVCKLPRRAYIEELGTVWSKRSRKRYVTMTIDNDFSIEISHSPTRTLPGSQKAVRRRFSSSRWMDDNRCNPDGNVGLQPGQPTKACLTSLCSRLHNYRAFLLKNGFDELDPTSSSDDARRLSLLGQSIAGMWAGWSK